MEPYIIDYYNQMPSCYHTIEKLNTEFETLQKENDLLENDLLNFIPERLNISYDEFLKRRKSALLSIKLKLKEQIIDKQKFIYIYSTFRCPYQLILIIEEAFNTISQENLKWSYDKSSSIVFTIDTFISSMSLYPCAILSNENILCDIIYKIIEKQFIESLNDIY